MNLTGTVIVDGRPVPIEGEPHLLTLIRKANIEIPTFCYHSELSTYGACRLCLVEINGRTIDASCVVPPKDGMQIRTSTARIRKMRKMNLELILANHTRECPTCDRSADCKLRSLSARLGVSEPRFRRTRETRPIDTGSVSLVRDPNKCILCGDCVRYCSEVQGIGAIDFAYRGEDVVVTPAFNKSLGDVDCVNCGQCAAVCPTAAIVPKSETEAVWKALDDERQTVVAQIAPAVRVALGEMFGLGSGQAQTGKIVAALRMLGFSKVYDTCFGADLTVLEEAHELGERLAAGTPGPMFTSCCPAWVKYAEQSFPELLPRLSSCMSPQSMVGALAKGSDVVAGYAGRPGGSDDGRTVTMVAIMPCTAKKFEARRDELRHDGTPLVDHVITTTELGRMIQEAGIRFADLPGDSMDLPMGVPTGAGVIFGNSGGVSEAVARLVIEESTGERATKIVFEPRDGNEGIRSSVLELGEGRTLRLAVVQGLANARRVAEEAAAGESPYDLVEVMACPGGCIGGAGQPVAFTSGTRAKRTAGLATADAELPLRRSQENPFVRDVYARYLGGEPGSGRAHELLHTSYRSRQRIRHTQISLVEGTQRARLPVKICVGTSCFLRGSQSILSELMERLAAEGSDRYVDLSATFCSEQCSLGPTVTVGTERLTGATTDAVLETIRAQLVDLAEESPA